MTQSRYIDTDRPATRLSRELVQALERHIPEQLAAGAFGVTVRGLLTAGLWPAWQLSRTARNGIRWRRNLVDHFAGWVSTEVGDIEAKPFLGSRRFAAEIVATRIAAGLGLVALMAAAVVVISTPSRLGLLWYADPFRGPYPTLAQAVFLGSLSLSFVMTWLAANLHLARGRQIARDLVELQEEPAKKPPKLPAWEWGLRPIPLFVAAILLAFGMLWAAPMLFAANAIRRVFLKHDRVLLNALAAYSRQRTARRAPPVDLAPTLGRVAVCPEPTCRSPLGVDARFCPRCGTTVRRPSEVLA